MRLPTGDEWEAAARGDDGRRWPWGESFDADRCACAEAGAAGPAPVGAHPGRRVALRRRAARRQRLGVGGATRPTRTAGAAVRGGCLPRPRLGRAGQPRPRRRPARAPRPPPAFAWPSTRTPTRRCHDRATRATPELIDRRPARRLRPLLRRPRHQRRRHGRRGGRARRRARTCDVDLVLTTGWCPFVASMSDDDPRRACATSTASRASTSRSSGTRCGRPSACRPSARDKLAMPLEELSPTASGASPTPRRSADRWRPPRPPPGARAPASARSTAFVFDCVCHIFNFDKRNAHRAARRDVRRAPLRLPPAADPRGRDGPRPRRVLQGVDASTRSTTWSSRARTPT